MMIVAVMIFNRQLGFILLEVGLSRTKFSRNVLQKNLGVTFVCILGFWAIGYSLSINAEGGFIGAAYRLRLGVKDYYREILVATSFCTTSSLIVSGCVAERMFTETYLAFTFLMVTLIYPICSSWVWGGGWLSEIGFKDFAGSGVVHMLGGFSGLLMTVMLGPRLGFGSKISKYSIGKA